MISCTSNCVGERRSIWALCSRIRITTEGQSAAEC
jgi:hypothetical protein